MKPSRSWRPNQAWLRRVDFFLVSSVIVVSLARCVRKRALRPLPCFMRSMCCQPDEAGSAVQCLLPARTWSLSNSGESAQGDRMTVALVKEIAGKINQQEGQQGPESGAAMQGAARTDAGSGGGAACLRLASRRPAVHMRCCAWISQWDVSVAWSRRGGWVCAVRSALRPAPSPTVARHAEAT